MQVSCNRYVHGASHQTACDETVVHRYHEEGDEIEDYEESHRVDFGVYFHIMGKGGTGHKCLIGFTDVEGVQVREDGFRNGQGHREEPDGSCLETDVNT